MKRAIAALLASASCVLAQSPFDGRWVLDGSSGAERRIFWLGVVSAGGLHGQFFGATGGRLTPLLDPVIEGGELRFRTERKFEGEKGRVTRALTTARLDNGKLTGETVIDGKPYRWTGWRAPLIADRDDGSWREERPVPLLSPGLSDWDTLRPNRKSDWRLENGVLSNAHSKADFLVSKRKFWNFRMRFDCRIPAKSNAGVGLRGRYEMQIVDDYGQPPDVLGNGSIYSRIAPSVNASRPPGEWQTFDVTLIGRQVTVVLNGTRIIDRREIEGLCGLPLDPHEDQPGPIWLQGDHGPVEYRNVVVIPLVRRSGR